MEELSGKESNLNSHSKRNLSPLDEACRGRGKETKGKSHHVRFKTEVVFIHVPSRDDYINSGIAVNVWWSEEDLIIFRKSLMNDSSIELRRFLICSEKPLHILVESTNNENTPN
jgi:hypothetical protein